MVGLDLVDRTALSQGQDRTPPEWHRNHAARPLTTRRQALKAAHERVKRGIVGVERWHREDIKPSGHVRHRAVIAKGSPAGRPMRQRTTLQSRVARRSPVADRAPRWGTQWTTGRRRWSIADPVAKA